MASSIYKNASGVTLAASASYKALNSTAAIVTGTDGADGIRSSGKGQDLYGGAGDDTYILQSMKDVVHESAGAGSGVDTIRSAFAHTLEANVENLTLEGPQAWYGGGNALGNLIQGSTGNETFDGHGGDDVLVGGGGKDTFIFETGAGRDVIQDFVAANDTVQLHGWGITSFSQVQSALKQVGADTLLTLSPTDSVLLRNVKVGDLQASNFQLGLDMSHLKQTFNDDFNSLSLESNGGLWRTKYRDAKPDDPFYGRTLNDEVEQYVDLTYTGSGTKSLGLNPFSINNGVLSITAAPAGADLQKELGGQSYTSGLLTTKYTFAQEYGYFDVRAKLPSGQGFWPAFWLLPTDHTWPPEIDIFEQLSKDPNTLFLTQHTLETGKATSEQFKVNVDNAATAFHDYGLLWTAQALVWYIDGVEVARTATPDDMHKPMYLLLDLAVGGAWAGAPTGQTAQFQIDYVRAYQLSDALVTGNSLGAGTTGGSTTVPLTAPDTDASDSASISHSAADAADAAAAAAAATLATAGASSASPAPPVTTPVSTPVSTPAAPAAGSALAPTKVLTGVAGTTDHFLVKMSDLDPNGTGAPLQIKAFQGAGKWQTTDNDWVNFKGFSKGSTVSWDHDSATDKSMGYYTLHDAASGHDFTLIVQSLNGGHLSNGDYAFI